MLMLFSSVITLATLLEVSTIQAIASSWQVVSGPLSTAWRAITNLSATAFSMTGAASELLILNCIVCSVTWNSSSTSDAKIFQSARTCSLSAFLTAKTIFPSRGMALCILPLLKLTRRRLPSSFSFSRKRKRARILMALARFLLMSSPEWPPLRPFSEASMKK